MLFGWVCKSDENQSRKKTNERTSDVALNAAAQMGQYQENPNPDRDKGNAILNSGFD